MCFGGSKKSAPAAPTAPASAPDPNNAAADNNARQRAIAAGGVLTDNNKISSTGSDTLGGASGATDFYAKQDASRM
jgi:hypothetical protein